MKFNLLVLFLMFSLLSFGQDNVGVIMTTPKTEMLIKGLVNPIEILVCSSEYDSLNLVGEHVSVKKYNDSCYGVIPVKVGFVTLYLLGYSTNRVDTLQSCKYNVKKVPPPRFLINRQFEGDLRRIVLQAHKYVFAGMRDFESFEGNLHPDILSFTMIFVFPDRIEIASSDSNIITEEQRKLIAVIPVGYKIYIVDVKGLLGRIEVDIPPTSYTIVE